MKPIPQWIHDRLKRYGITVIQTETSYHFMGTSKDCIRFVVFKNDDFAKLRECIDVAQILAEQDESSSNFDPIAMGC